MTDIEKLQLEIKATNRRAKRTVFITVGLLVLVVAAVVLYVRFHSVHH